jgi:hypothetical protein
MASESTSLGPRPTDLFSAYEVSVPGVEVPAFFIETTASANIEGPAIALDQPAGTRWIDADAAIDKIVVHLLEAERPKLVVTVHGFNNPRDAVLKSYEGSFRAVAGDAPIRRANVAFIGYRWPSERAFSLRQLVPAWNAAPWFLIGTLGIGLLVLVSIPHLPSFGGPWAWVMSLVAVLAALAASISVTLLLMRIVVYFRDIYRATSVGVPGLVEIIRHIDARLREAEERKAEAEARDARSNFVDLSFIGHSMGAFVVTNVVRILSDVFAPGAIREKLNSSVESTAEPDARIGEVFCLKRLVLVAPDIPAEALLSSRHNVLRASLRRFDEAYLFSNEWDEVLRQISTTANYFSFPTGSRDFGYRLGNVGISGKHYGIAKGGVDLARLRLGYMDLDKLYARLAQSGPNPPRDLPHKFSYFDCTDCVEDGAGVLTWARPGNDNAMNPARHVLLLLAYFWNRRPDVHGGYFSAVVTRTIIYRLVCLGFTDTVRAYADDGTTLDKVCTEHQVKVVLGPRARAG